MNKSMIIYNKNISKNILKEFDNNQLIGFNYNCQDKYKNLDEYISKEIIEKLIQQNIDIIFIKDSLSSNYLELYGLIIAYHIRLSSTKLKYLPIIILSDIDGFTLLKAQPYISNILFTRNIFLEPSTKSTIEKYKNKYIEQLHEKDFKSKFLDLIEIKSPENSTNHSIANEWAIFKWAKELKISNSNDINKTISNISYQLYFKYLLQKNEVKEKVQITEEKHSLRQRKGGLKFVKIKDNFEKRVLIIDDELDRGWGDIFIEYFNKKRKYIEPSILPIEFKNKKYENIEQIMTEYIIGYNPDLIILDMRLLNSDHSENNPENISGIRLLEKIKDTSLQAELNPGIQVIMLSATTRSDILEQASKDNKIVGYIQKDHIDSIVTTKDNIEKLNKLIVESEEKFFLKEIWKLQKEILLSTFLNSKEFKKIPEIKNIIEVIFEVLNSNISKPLNFVMFNIFKCIEYINEYYIEKDKRNIAYWRDNRKEIKTFYKQNEPNNNFPHERKRDDSNNSTENKIRMIMHEKLAIKDNDNNMLIKKLVCNRNYHMHTEGDKPHCKQFIEEEIKTDSIIEWVKLLEKIISTIDKQNKSI